MGRLKHSKSLWIALAGFCIVLVGFFVTATTSKSVGVVITLAGALFLFVNAIMIFIASRGSTPRAPRTAEEIRRNIRAMADDMKQSEGQ